jgi:hypothetical protein
MQNKERNITISQLEEDIFKMEGIRIVIRRPKYSVLENSKLYHEIYQRKVSGTVPVRR